MNFRECVWVYVHVCAPDPLYPPFFILLTVFSFAFLCCFLSPFLFFERLPYSHLISSLLISSCFPFSSLKLIYHQNISSSLLIWCYPLLRSSLITPFLLIFRYLILRSCLLELMDKEIILPKLNISKTCPTSVSGPQTNGRSKARSWSHFFFFSFFLFLSFCLRIVQYWVWIVFLYCCCTFGFS